MKLKLFNNKAFLPVSAIVVFIAMIAVLVILKRTTGKTPLSFGYRAKRKARRAGRRVPSYAYKGRVNPHFRRQWDAISGSSTYSRDMISGRRMGGHIHLA